MAMDNENTSSSFTELLGLPPNKAMELLHHQDVAVPAGKADFELETQGSVERNPKFLNFPPPFRFSPTFPSNMELVEKAAKFSVFASDLSSPSSTGLPLNSPNNSSPNVKPEPSDSDFSRPTHLNHGPPEKSKVKSGGKKKKRKNDGGGGEEKVELPYIHVRARRGQATDSHSLAERARREKINARMKFLRELVPGCSKISGTALVLEEIINHVQSLQRQVEFLSMRLSSVNPRIDYGVLDRFLAAEDASATSGDGDGVVDVVRRKQLDQNWQLDLPPLTYHHQFSSLQVCWDRDDDIQQLQQHGLVKAVHNPGPSLFCFDSANSVIYFDVLGRIDQFTMIPFYFTKIVRKTPPELQLTKCLHLVRCDTTIIRDISILGDFNSPNNDGIDIEDSNNTVITGCHIDTGDDAICPKSSTGPVHNLTATDCWIRTKSSAIKFGSASWFDFKNMYFNNITIVNSHRGLSLQIRDGGNVSNVTFSNIKISTRYYDPSWWGRAEPIYITTCPRDSTSTAGSISNLLFENISAVSENGVFLSGSVGGLLTNLKFNNVNLTYKRWTDFPGGLVDYRPGCRGLVNHSTAGIMMEHVSGLELNHVSMRWSKNNNKGWDNPLQFKPSTVSNLSFHELYSDIY